MTASANRPLSAAALVAFLLSAPRSPAAPPISPPQISYDEPRAAAAGRTAARRQVTDAPEPLPLPGQLKP
jgi:hypothetical protein